MSFENFTPKRNYDRLLKGPRREAVIEFNMDGSIIKADKSFLLYFGYSLKDIKNKHQNMFIENTGSPEYLEFWKSLNEGSFEARRFKKTDEKGNINWIQAIYCPIPDMNGSPYKVVVRIFF